MSDGQPVRGERWWAQTRVYLGVTLACVVIWLFAEVQGLDERFIESEIRLVSPASGSLRLRPADDQDWTGALQVRAQIRGSRGALSRVERQLAAGLDLTPEHPAAPVSPGIYAIDLAQVISQDPAMAQAGLRVVAVEPAAINVRVVRLTTREVEIEPVLAEAEILGDPTVAPARAQLTAPEFLLRRMDEQDQEVRVLASPRPDALQALPTGEARTITVRLRPPPALASDADVSIQPAAAQLTLTLQSRLETITVAPTPIWIAIPPTEVGRWTGPFVDGDPFLGEVRVRGPRSLIERIRAGEVAVLAVATLSSDELERGVSEKAVSFALLEAGSLSAPPASAQFETDERTVRLRFSRRESPAPAGQGAAPNRPQPSDSP